MCFFFFFQAEDGIRDRSPSRGLGDVYKRQVLYFVSRECPVIGMLDSNHAVLITAYTSSTVSWMDPQTRKSKTVSIHVAENMFKNAGYKFVSYISD